MNEVKFKAWERNLKEIIPVYNIDFEKKMINTGSAWRFFHEVELIQYTGLNDIEQFEHPKKLYTGDIVSMHQFLFDGTEYENEVVGMLTYDDDAACVCLAKIKHDGIRRYMGYEEEDTEFEEEQVPVCFFYGLHECSWTYLGNIYENPELLGGKVNEG